MRTAKYVIGLLCLILVAGCVPAPQKPNVIYILADDLGYGDLSCYGQQKLQTPNIDRLAGEGLRFTAHYSGNTVCSPSRAVLMTGQHPGHCYVRGNTDERTIGLDETMTVLPELFKQSGYATGAYGKWGLGHTNATDNQNPLKHGFDEYAGWESQTIAHTYFPTKMVVNGQEVPLAEGTYIHDEIMRKAFDFVKRNAESKTPFFCYIPTAIPHAAMHAPKDLHEKWRKKLPQFDAKIGKYGAGDEPCPDVPNPIAGFGAMIEHLDNQVGQLLDMLHELGIDDNTIIMFASDNGAHHEGGHDPTFWNSTGGLRGGKRDMHEGGIRTPMLVRWPAVVAEGQTTDHLSAFWDVMPTMAEILDQPVPEQSDGLSFLPTLRGKPDKQQKHKYIYIEFHKGNKLFSQAVRVGSWKAYVEAGQTMEIFNLDDDPYEQNDLADKQPDIVQKMQAIIKEAHTPLSQ